VKGVTEKGCCFLKLATLNFALSMIIIFVEFDVPTEVFMKIAVFLDIALVIPYINRRFKVNC
jgi:hypothetical protein